MKTAEEIIKEVRESPEGKVKLAIVDIDGILRGKVIHRDKFLSILESGFGFCDVVFGWDMLDSLYDNADFTGWHSGYPDAKARVDLTTYRRVPWDHNIPFFLADFRNKKDEGLEICPRSLLKKVRKEAEGMGFTPFFSQEFEWFNFKIDEEPVSADVFRRPTPITTGMFGYSLLRAWKNKNYFNDLFNLLGQFGIPLEGLHTETGPGVYEAAILYSEVLEAADRATLFKAAVKEIASRHRITSSFMAKWNNNLPGCGGHLHQSLWDSKRQVNLFHDERDTNQMSATMKSYLAGQLHCLPYLMPLFAPTVNSYKRLVEGAWAPTTVTWGIDNRTTAIRVLPGSSTSTRLEFRVVGSDVNPYLAMAASLASGLYGIKKKMELKVPATVGSGYSNKTAVPLARDLHQATEMMKNSPLAAELFGEIFVKHFCQTREWEWRQYASAVTDWDLKRYFETV
ncbi:MAG: glutamine synthetase family protein [Deltaproteobacteria bacterium]|nr:glutamine synthetase family protein [Deltaproteobacteria bacterium]